MNDLDVHTVALFVLENIKAILKITKPERERERERESWRDGTLTQGGMVMLRLHNTCCVSSYLVDFRRKDRNPVASLFMSLTWFSYLEIG